ncbi:hypothetical protein ILUMI_01884, partial [Ignelater luminosus]
IRASCFLLQLNFFQNEYDIKMDVARVSWFNTTFYKYIKADFVPYNRTARVFNSTCELLIDLNNDVILHIQAYKLMMMSNQYRFFPVTVNVNACAEYTKNTFGVKDILSKVSNMRLCNMKKGFYYIRNATPDFSKFPPHLPRGSYRMEANFTYYSSALFTLEFYGKIKDKPIDWKNIPKHNWR